MKEQVCAAAEERSGKDPEMQQKLPSVQTGSSPAPPDLLRSVPREVV